MKIIVMTFFMCMVSASIHGQDKRIDDLFSDYSGKCPGAALLISLNDQIVYEKSFGYANLEGKISCEPRTNFRLASVTKEFTAASILILIQNGLLKFDTKLTEIFSEFPMYGEKITIKHLLNHTAGLIDYEDLIPDTATIQVKDADVMHMMLTVDSTYFEPGTQFKYSNTGYALLALTIEKITGKTFAKFLKENIFEPLKMDNTIAHEEGISVVENRAFGYDKTNSSWIRKDQSLTSAVLGDGGIYSNVEDMFKWDQSLYSSKILSDDLRKESMTRAILNNGKKIDYGFGWHLKIYKDEEIVYHGGSTQGFRNIIYRVPSKKFTIIILTNRNEGSTEKIADEIFEMYYK